MLRDSYIGRTAGKIVTADGTAGRRWIAARVVRAEEKHRGQGGIGRGRVVAAATASATASLSRRSKLYLTDLSRD